MEDGGGLEEKVKSRGTGGVLRSRDRVHSVSETWGQEGSE
jgi:hypothetical protein